MIALDLPTTQTFDFVSAHTPRGRCRILEVGCGNGALAEHLQRAGHDVVALDSSNDAIAIARERGVDARVCRWPEFADGSYNVVIFSRSLHHMPDLAAALIRARQLVAPDGVVLVDDFAFAEAESADVMWFYTVLHALREDGVRFLDDADFVQRILTQAGNSAAWHTDHDETLHSAGAMETALTTCVGPTVVTHVPYLYRYVAASLAPGAETEAVVKRVLAEEWRSAALGQIALVGRQLVARPAA
jgi:SAM-dependent methyltransferase